MRSACRLGIALAVLLAVVPAGGPRAAAEEPSFFTRRVAPVLRQRCVECHNRTKTRGGLDLTRRDLLLQGGDTGPALVPGDAAGSLLIRMVSGAKPKMPRQGPPLTPEQIADLRHWVADGAPWPKGVVLTPAGAAGRAGADWWALRPLTRPAVPAVRGRGWVRTPPDAFILATLEAKGLSPALPADRATLIRRVTFDLHGLPPTPAEIDAFVNDPAADAYERLIDRLLASPRYGERLGRHWLDVVHYGDTHGYDKDKRRDHAWPYRDYVIRSFNADKPYARFVKEQIAGDVLFPGDPDGVIATGFIAAGPWDFVGHVELREGTVDKLKTRLLDRDDMVANTVSTFTSMTAHCARCHDHKFDPIPQRDYYRLQAVFAGVDRGDRPYANRKGLQLRAELDRQRQALTARRAALLRRTAAVSSPELARLDADLKGLKVELAALPAPPKTAASPTNGYHSAISPKPDVEKWVQVDLGRTAPLDEIRLIPARPTDFPDTPGFGFPVRFRVAVADDPAFARSETVADHTAADFPNPGDDPFLVRLSGRQARYVRVTATRLWPRTGDYVFALAELQVESGGKNVARRAAVTALDSIEAGRWARKNLVDDFDSRNRLPDLSDPGTAALVKRRELQAGIQQRERDRRALADSLIDAPTRADLARTQADLAALEKRLKDRASAEMVYAVLPHTPRPIAVLARGDVEKPGEPVGAGALSAVPGLEAEFKLADPNDEGGRRAALAGWVADPRNVLTWRSIVNRVWHYHFGRGLVDTPNDFGYNGGRPTHPELLDWLAVEFRERGGSVKELHRLILLSSTYRQSSRGNPAFAKVDADNRFLWRMNRQRLDAESVRDAVLAVSGKLDLSTGGPGFELFRFKDDHSPVYDHAALDKINNPATWRRTVYRFVVRSVPNPFLECLDCADPNINTPVRNTTLTALQALALLNDPFMVKQSEYFAGRLRKVSDDPSRQIETAFRLAFGRAPTAEETGGLVAYVRKHGLANACRVLFNANEFVFID
jgi:mono/diheme cytochrome c family protein